MEHPGFFENAGPFSLSEIAKKTGAILGEGADGTFKVSNILPLDEASADHLSFFDNRKYLDQFKQTSASACFVSEKFAGQAPEKLQCLITPQPYHAFAKALLLFYPKSMNSKYALTGEGYKAGPSFIHETAQIGKATIVEPGAVIGPEVIIGSNCHIGAGSVIGYRVYLGNDCYIGPNVSLSHSLIGNQVRIHAGCSIGQDGFGFAMGPSGHVKVPQIGRVIIQDDVEVGANSTIDRGALRDTIIGQGTKIDNLVQIGHNVITGQNCIIVAQTGISGSTTLGDFVVLGGQAGIAGHLEIASGVQLAASSKVKDNIEKAGRYGGIPAKPFLKWAREIAAIEKLGKRKQDN